MSLDDEFYECTGKQVNNSSLVIDGGRTVTVKIIGALQQTFFEISKLCFDEQANEQLKLKSLLDYNYFPTHTKLRK